MQALARKSGLKASSASSFTPILWAAWVLEGGGGRVSGWVRFARSIAPSHHSHSHSRQQGSKAARAAAKPPRTHRSLLWRSASEKRFSHESDTCSTLPPSRRGLTGLDRLTIFCHTTLPSAAAPCRCCCRGGDRERGRRLLAPLLPLGLAGEPSVLPLPPPPLSLLLGEGLSPSKV